MATRITRPPSTLPVTDVGEKGGSPETRPLRVREQIGTLGRIDVAVPENGSRRRPVLRRLFEQAGGGRGAEQVRVEGGAEESPGRADNPQSQGVGGEWDAKIGQPQGSARRLRLEAWSHAVE